MRERVQICDVPDGVVGMQFVRQVEVRQPQLAWAWLHTLRTGKRARNVTEIDEFAMNEKLRLRMHEFTARAPRRPRPRIRLVVNDVALRVVTEKK